MLNNIVFGNSNNTNVTQFKKCSYTPVPRTDKKGIVYYQEIEKYGIILRQTNGLYMTKDKSGHFHLNVKGANQVKNESVGFKNGWMSLAKILWIIRHYPKRQFQYIADIMKALNIEVHHKDKDFWNNTPENLTLTTHDKHKRFDCVQMWNKYDIPSEMKVENKKCEEMIKSELKAQMYKF